jgi:formiminotetrahydrofolate cyclodeaminase
MTAQTPQSRSDQLIHLPVDEFLAVLAGDTTVPGGGSAAALAGSLGAALAGMVARLTAGRPRYAAVEDEMAAWRDQADALRVRLAALVDADAEAYGRVSAAYRLPKDTDEQKAGRRAAIRTALEGALLPPLQTAAACVDVLEMIPSLIAHGNRNAVTDASVGALLAHAGLRAAVRNVLVNIDALSDKGVAHDARARTVELLSAGQNALSAALAAAGSGE